MHCCSFTIQKVWLTIRNGSLAIENCSLTIPICSFTIQSCVFTTSGEQNGFLRRGFAELSRRIRVHRERRGHHHADHQQVDSPRDHLPGRSDEGRRRHSLREAMDSPMTLPARSRPREQPPLHAPSAGPPSTRTTRTRRARLIGRGTHGRALAPCESTIAASP